FYYKHHPLPHPLITQHHIPILHPPTPQQLQQMKQITTQLNQQFNQIFSDSHLNLIHFNLEFPIHHHNRILLPHHISPHTSTLCHKHT
ncbi:phosphoribosylaminoimidazolesuccinocarboxamide synthase, partial [Bacillus altitudinis]|uniref:phosphoribosylaminoimidazolesuccinocarboxamide synthase n=1 Tax=Bacillus altitudinis TaxID=293387 RepID=UPI002352919A